MINFKKTYKGVTFVEMIVTIAITSIVMLGASLFFVKMWTMNHFAIKSGVASFVASNAVEDAINTMRKAQQAQNGAFPIELADDHEFIFYADYDNDGIVERVRYFVEDSIFKRGITEPDTSTPPEYSGTEEVRDMANNITNDVASGEVIFEYYDVDGTIYEYDDINGMALETMATPADVRMVKIVLYVNPEPIFRSPDDVRIESFVVVRNLTEFDDIPT
ncbi:MAG: prepilin-type N-terminal cleavage/methylation domain-containing protein [Candidatus Moraniibacteriota bacterium]|jgi:prepilin-type N-terminal cleavage/methylation domain-containing protein